MENNNNCFNILTDREKELLDKLASKEYYDQIICLINSRGIKQQIEETKIFHYSNLTMDKLNKWLDNLQLEGVYDKNKTDE